ncbi:MAG TPA: SDR family NAD(P)-dependent oxidoreductase [Aggregatilineales bacterium]|nr:SDR family NAD(P)-dependent oxidoreductase [Aggregatilineales bacterium]
MLLSGKVAVITGGAGDLGNAMALHLAQEGAAVSLWDIKSEAEAAPQIDRIKSATLNVHYQQVDIRDRVAVDAAFNAVMEQFGSLDIVCANAGIVEAAPFLEITPESWTRHIEINLTGSFHVGQQAARLMVRQGKGGRIIFTSTWVSAIPWPEITAYTASKGGLNMLMKQMARELAPHKILVNAIAPGIVKAGLAGRQLVEEPQYAARVAKVIPLGEPGTPEEIARAVVYLAGPHTAYMTGSILTLDGGCSLFQFDS